LATARRWAAERADILVGNLLTNFRSSTFPGATVALLVSRLHDWVRNGWSGEDADEIQVTNVAATLVESSEKRDHVSIGYEVNMRRFMATDQIIDPRYKVGADFDLLLRYRHGIANLNGCAEGVHANDEYRIVQVSRDDISGRTDRIESRRDDVFEMIRQAGVYQLLERH
jgi:hypothetical protein